MEIEFFCHPDESMKWYQYWRDVRKNWYTQLGIKSDKLRPREQGKEELAHYSIGTTDIEYLFPFAEEPQELEGVAHRGDYDLTQHTKHSGKDLTYFDEEAWERDKADRYQLVQGRRQDERDAGGSRKYRFMPHVIEPSAGADRFTLAVLCEAYAEDESRRRRRGRCMHFHPRLAPIKAADLAAGEQGRDAGDRAEALSRTEAATSTSSTTTRARSAGAIAGRTRRARRTASPSTGRRCKTTP